MTLQPLFRFLLAIAPVVIALPTSAATTCSSTSDTCAGPHSSLFAIGHDHNEPSAYLQYRVKLPEQATTTNWGDGTNGFFYRVSLDGKNTWQNWVPVNGVGTDSTGAPTLRPFSFTVKSPVAATSLFLEACASNYLPVQANSPVPACKKSLWTDEYDSLPVPTVGASPLGPITLELLDAAISVRNNGSYGAPIVIQPMMTNDPATLTEEQITWLYDHLVFLDSDNNVYSNDVFSDSVASPSFAALSIEEAAFETSPNSGEYRVKFAKVDDPVKPIDPSTSASKQFWVYSTNTSNVNSGKAIQVSMGWLYDASAKCPGALSADDNSN